jgi:hypothetical protein
MVGPVIGLSVLSRRSGLARFRVLAFLCAAVLAGTVAQTTHAKGTPLKGEVVGSRPVFGYTGDCVCESRWYTLGANPGRLQILASMRKPADEISNQYGMRTVLMHGTRIVSLKSALCFVGQKHCSGTTVLTISVRHRGIYYIRIDGNGAHEIPYTLQVKGSLYALRCGKTC